MILKVILVFPIFIVSSSFGPSEELCLEREREGEWPACLVPAPGPHTVRQILLLVQLFSFILVHQRWYDSLELVVASAKFGRNHLSKEPSGIGLYYLGTGGRG